MLVVAVVAMDLVQHAQDSVMCRQVLAFPRGLDRAHIRMRRHDVEAMADAAVAVADASVRAHFVGRPMAVARVHVPVPNTANKKHQSPTKALCIRNRSVAIFAVSSMHILYTSFSGQVHAFYRFTSMDFRFFILWFVECMHTTRISTCFFFFLVLVSTTCFSLA